ncbi:MAG: hypothetical protein J1G05_05340 [Clostridiales bacterium]|nr:hypothetical protein [Clostridiales bacterium]
MEKDKSAKKQIPLRISDSLYAELERWAADEFRSVNGQIEYLLTECVKSKRKVKKNLTDAGEEDKI